MSRIGKLPVQIPDGVTVDIKNHVITVKGPKGTLAQEVDSALQLEVNDKELIISRPNDLKRNRSLHGLFRSLIQNMVTGVTEGYEKRLQIVGVGYRASREG